MDQAHIMVDMRIKIDVWSKGTDEEIRENIRERFMDLFSQLPARRLWFYLKHIQNMSLRMISIDSIVSRTRSMDVSDIEKLTNGPEDIIAKGDVTFYFDLTLS